VAYVLEGDAVVGREPGRGSVEVNQAVKPPSTPQTPRPPLAGPANLTAITFSPNVIVLSWDSLTAATGYKLERSTDGTHWTRVALTPAGTTTFADTGLAPGTTYYYRVRASTPRDHTAYSPTITAATVPQTLPDVPESFLHSPLVNGHEGLLLHIHPTLTIFIDGQQVVIPANTNITPRGLYPIHTHDDTGTIHVESTVPYTFHLKDFFNLWSFTTNDPTKVFNSQQLLGHPIDADHLVIVTVNGQPITDGPDVVLNNDDGSLFSEGGKNIVIFYETLPGS
ncbi:MAG TPA: fibronectin type III domain-containing protein, partial [Isosphaeraceae bacterium]|nr:fibronectin type III domain-containing protein [Isosphaeraceae bacterium]